MINFTLKRMFVSINDSSFKEINKSEFLHYDNVHLIFAFLRYYYNHEETKKWL